MELMLTNQKPNDSVLVVEDDLMLDDSDAVTLDSLALNSTVHSATCRKALASGEGTHTLHAMAHALHLLE